MKVASLDLGSNSFLCLIAKVENSSISQVYRDESRIVRLSEGVATTGVISSAALDRAKIALQEFAKIISSEHVDQVIAVTTAVARQASNSQLFFNILDELKIPVRLLSGNEEADITFQGAISGIKNPNHSVVIDIGGGSTEIIFGSHYTKMKAKSFNFGVVRLKDLFQIENPMSEKQIKDISQHIDNEISDYIKQSSNFKIDQIIAVAGTPTTLAAMEIGQYIPNKVDGYIFTIESLEQWFRTLSQLSSTQIRETYKVEKGRADVISIGVLILIRILKLMSVQQLSVSIRGVRYGVALRALGGN